MAPPEAVAIHDRPLADILGDAQRILERASARSLTVRLVGAWRAGCTRRDHHDRRWRAS